MKTLLLLFAPAEDLGAASCLDAPSSGDAAPDPASCPATLAHVAPSYAAI